MLDTIVCWTSRKRRHLQISVSPFQTTKQCRRLGSTRSSVVQPNTSCHCDDANDVLHSVATTVKERVADPECWICLSNEAKEVFPAEDGTGGGVLEMPEQLCKCPRKVHPSCLRQWQLAQMGTMEETHCKFCSVELPSVCNPATLASLKHYMRCIQILENVLLLLSFLFCVGPFLLLMVYFSDPSHPCSSNDTCLAVAVSMTCSQILTIGISLFCAWKVKPYLIGKWTGLGLPREQSLAGYRADIEPVPNEWEGLV